MPVFERLIGDPYPWQSRLFSMLCEGRIPEAIDIPTGLGKTKVIAAWLAARAEGAALPRRLIYVVDRRAVVDQATTEAEQLASTLVGILGDKKLDASQRAKWGSSLGLGDTDELPISTLRGQHIDNRKWMDRPHAVAIVVGTVDMIGSRLLFSGYGVNPHVRSVHAGLLGCDSLVVLDESHLVPPFERMLDRVVALRGIECQRNPMLPAFRVMALSATGRDRGTGSTFRLDDIDRADPRVRARLTAEKRLFVRDLVPTTQLAERLADRAWELAQESRRVIVFSNSRKIAQEVEADLAQRCAKRYGKEAKLAELFVGERRLRERMRLYDPIGSSGEPSIVPRFLAGASAQSGPAFLIATSAGEVGVDFDADDLVCDLVSWERMVQRFGRVNRRAAPGRAFIEIVPSISEKDAENEVAADRLATLLAPFESAAWPQAPDGSRDASAAELDRLKRDPAFEPLLRSAQTPPPYYPALSTDFVSAWSLTTLREHTGRAQVAPFLRGWVDERPQASICWRLYFPVRADFERDGRDETTRELVRFFEALPPHATELLEAPAERIAEVIKKRADAFDADGSGQRHPPLVVSLNERNAPERIWSVADLRSQKKDSLTRDFSGHTLVIDARLGGIAESGLFDEKCAAQATTIDGDPKLWSIPLETTAQRRVRFGSFEGGGVGDWRPAGYRWQVDPDADDGDELWVEVWRGPGATHGDAAVTRYAQTLSMHHEWTRDDAEHIALGLNLPEDKVRMLSAAAAFHDAGKDRALWQDAMRADSDDRPYAKTIGGANVNMLGGYRHELGSLADAPRSEELKALQAADRDLALHLITAHHGRGRPFMPAIDPNLPPVRARALAAEAAIRFARLQQEWGPWGLAWWEALLRAADWSASRRVDEDGKR
jgi:CRISPR-associated endonuclease/helicase Cas3